jgi:hypothetical protein
MLRADKDTTSSIQQAQLRDGVHNVPVVPIKTSIEDMEKFLGYMNRQIGWIEVAKLQKSLGVTAVDDRKVAAMVALGFLQRDGGNLKITERGKVFAGGDKVAALRAAISDSDLYRSTIEWIRYANKTETTAADIGQYWESHHKDTLGALKGSTLKDGAVFFGRVADGAGLGEFKVGRAGKETRFTSDLARVAEFLDSASPGSPLSVPESQPEIQEKSPTESRSLSESVDPPAPTAQGGPSTTVSASPNVHVNVEIHIAADATADTVKEIFKNMARYVLDRPVAGDDD